MKINNSYNSSMNSFQILVTMILDGENYNVGRIKFENTKQWEEEKSKLVDRTIHPSDEFAKVIKYSMFKNYEYITLEDIQLSYLQFTFIDSIPTIEF